MSRVFQLVRRLSTTVIFPIFWTAFTLTLLCIPGYALPGLGLWGIKHLDKIAHVILFGGFVLFWGIYAWERTKESRKWQLSLIFVTLVSIGIGVGMEYFQIAYIPNRSFDDWDIVADFVGSVSVMWILFSRGRKWKLIV